MQNSPTIPWRTRSDLTSVDLGGFNESSFAVKDLIKNEFFSFGELEFFILQSLQETLTIGELQLAIKNKFDITVDDEELVSYTNRLAQDNLLVGERFGDGRRLYQQNKRETGGLRKQKLMGLLSIKLPGFYPGPLLKQLRLVGWLCFNPVSIVLVAMATLATIIYAGLAYQSVLNKAPSFAELISPNHLFLMMVGFIIAKILHELGHGLACQNAGHECSEMGMMLLVFMPVLYCDVSDLWTEKSRWKRIFVSLAGVFIELALATACFWGWYFSLDGQFSRFLFGMMLVTSLNTLFINGNPLMRYDGYYALSDLVGIPNLGANSKNYLTEKIEHYFIRHDQHVYFNRNGWMLGTYAVSSFIYRWLIMFAIGWAIWAFFDSQQLSVTGSLVVGLVILISVIPLVMNLTKSIRKACSSGLRFLNAAVFLGLVAFCVFVVCSFEFNHRVSGQAEIQLTDARHLFAPADGKLMPSLADGDSINKGGLVAQIISDDLELEKVSIEGALADIKLRLSALEFETESSLAAGEIEFWKKRKTSNERKLIDIKKRISALEIRSPIDGRVVMTRRPEVDSEKAEQNLSLVEGDMFGEKNKGCHVRRGDNLCYVAKNAACSGFVKVSEKDIELVKIGQTVRVFVPHASQFLEGTVSKVSLESEPELANDGGPANKDLPTSFYAVEFQFESDPRIRIGSVHKAVILCQQTTPAKWLSRWWQNSMWF
ncbi:MAG: site-2 protease family protein [Mariniblastus sp.]